MCKPSADNLKIELVVNWVSFVKVFLLSPSGPAKNKKTFKKWTQCLVAAQEEAMPGRTSLSPSIRQTSREFALKKIVKCKRKVDRLLAIESTFHNLIIY
jgi:hypothetical protein